MSKQDNGINGGRRRFLEGAAALAAAGAIAPYVMNPGRARAAGSLADVTKDAAAAAKKLAEGRKVTLTILEPSGSIGNIKPVAERWTADTGIEIKYIEVPLGEIDQKVLLESVSKTGSFDIALPATFGIPTRAQRIAPADEARGHTVAPALEGRGLDHARRFRRGSRVRRARCCAPKGSSVR